MKKLIYIALLGLIATSCTEDTMDNINKDTQNPPVNAVPVKLQITDGIMATGFTTMSGSYAWYVSSYTEQEFGTGNNQLMNAELRKSVETASSSTFNNEWNGTYANLLNLKQIIDKVAPDKVGQGQIDILGMAQVLYALNFGVLTDLHGDIPCSEALKGLENTTPALDKQQDVYNNCIFKNLDMGITNLKAAVSAGINAKKGNAGSQDILYANDCKKWIGAAYALKARYLLHTMVKNSAILPKVEEACDSALSFSFQGMDITVFDGDASNNPWWAYYASREYTGSSKTVADLMKSLNDPRYDVYVTPFVNSRGKASPILIGEPGNEAQAKLTSGVSRPAWLDDYFGTGANASIHMMSASELYFIKAEVQLRRGEDATDAFSSAIGASFADYQNFTETSLNSEAYIASLGAPTLKKLFEQKYLSQCRDEQIEAYNDIRRCEALGEKYIILTNPNNLQGGINRWPKLLPYGNSSVISNPTIKAAYGDGTYIFTTKSWIFGGN